MAPFCLFLLLSVVSILSFQERIFPFVKIVLKKKDKAIFGLDELQTILIIVASLATILEFIYVLLIKK
jgi:hypothetical protein